MTVSREKHFCFVVCWNLKNIIVSLSLFAGVATVSSSDDKKVNPDSTVSSVSTVGEVTSSDTTSVTSQPSAASPDKVCAALK